MAEVPWRRVDTRTCASVLSSLKWGDNSRYLVVRIKRDNARRDFRRQTGVFSKCFLLLMLFCVCSVLVLKRIQVGRLKRFDAIL